MEVNALACELPSSSGVPLSRWSAAEVAREAVERGIVAEISGAAVRRWLSEDAIRPFYHRSWSPSRLPGSSPAVISNGSSFAEHQPFMSLPVVA